MSTGRDLDQLSAFCVPHKGGKPWEMYTHENQPSEDEKFWFAIEMIFKHQNTAMQGISG